MESARDEDERASSKEEQSQGGSGQGPSGETCWERRRGEAQTATGQRTSLRRSE